MAGQLSPPLPPLGTIGLIHVGFKAEVGLSAGNLGSAEQKIPDDQKNNVVAHKQAIPQTRTWYARTPCYKPKEVKTSRNQQVEEMTVTKKADEIVMKVDKIMHV